MLTLLLLDGHWLHTDYVSGKALETEWQCWLPATVVFGGRVSTIDPLLLGGRLIDRLTQTRELKMDQKPQIFWVLNVRGSFFKKKKARNKVHFLFIHL